MTINEKGLELVKSFEGLFLDAYYCPANVLTIGYGHTGKDVAPGQRITEAEAVALLARDLEEAERGVRARLKRPPNENQLAACTSLAFNVGVAGFAKSSVARLHDAGDFAGAARAFLLWNKATGADGKLKELKGLTRRRAAEADLYLAPVANEPFAEPLRTRAADVVPEGAAGPSAEIIGGSLAAAATIVGQIATDIEPMRAAVAAAGMSTALFSYLLAGLAVAGGVLVVLGRLTRLRHGRG